MAWYWPVSPGISDSDVLQGLPDDLDNFSCAQWQTYYLRLKQKYGKDFALLKIQEEGERVGVWADLHACKYNCDFISFFKSEGLQGGNLFSKVFCAVDTVADTVTDTVETVGEIASQTNNAVKNGGLLLVAVAAGFWYFNSINKNGKS